MAIYDVSAQLTLFMYCERQIDATNPAAAEAEMRDELRRAQAPDGEVYGVTVENIKATKRTR